jgi:hypothetical protein
MAANFQVRQMRTLGINKEPVLKLLLISLLVFEGSAGCLPVAHFPASR